MESCLYGVRPRCHYADPLIQPRFWFPTLQQLASSNVAQMITQKISKIRFQSDHWKTKEWIAVREHLKTNLSSSVLQDVLVKHMKNEVDPDCPEPVPCPYCFQTLKAPLDVAWKTTLRSFNASKTALLFWLFSESELPPLEKSLYDPPFMCEYDLPITSLIIKTPAIKEELERCLKRQVHIKEIELILDKKTNGVELELLAKHCKLRKFTLKRGNDNSYYGFHDWQPFEQVNKLCVFLKSQAPSLEELVMMAAFDKFGECQFEELIQLCKSVLELCHLRSLKLNEVLFDFVLTHSNNLGGPCKIQSLHVTHNNEYWAVEEGLLYESDVPAGAFDKLFPDLKSFKIYSKHSADNMLARINSSKATDVQLRVLDDPINVFQCLSFFPNSAAFDVYYIDYFDNFSLGEPTMTSSLTKLVIRAENFIEFLEFKHLFQFFPNIKEMALKLRGIGGFDENEFVAFLPNVQQQLGKLQSLDLALYIHPTNMTGATALAILRNSKLEKFNMGGFKFSPREFEELKRIAQERGLTIVWGYEKEQWSFPWRFPCDSGVHIWE